jgi:hypothetical protein
MKVLIFCQRKQSFDQSDCHKVKYVVEKLEKFIINHYQPDEIKFEYLTQGLTSSSKSLYDADYKMLFDLYGDKEDRIKSIDFIRTHYHHYDMILLQTCPIILLINQLPFLFMNLKKNGIILFTNFSFNKEDSNIIKDEDIIPVINYISNNGFIKSNNSLFSEYIKNYDDLIIF